MSPYRDRRASLATQHGKQSVIAAPFRRILGIQIVTPPGLDTDALGTFSGEVERRGTPLEVCIAKARLGMAASGLPFGFANEGSFGPHPLVPFIPGGVEVMTFVDDENGLVISESLIAEKTNYGHREARSLNDIEDWLPLVGFPSHALIVRPKSPDRTGPAEKGLIDLDLLGAAIARAASRSEHGLALVEPDMRAHLNPTRMSSIRKLAIRLARRLATPCPICAAPGWGQTGTMKGLPCEDCTAPTGLIQFRVFRCTSCSHSEEKPRPDGLQMASPQYCPECNP